MNTGAPIFIVGAPRSGTTLLQYMLRSHPDISLPTGESHFFVPLLKQQAEYGDLSARENIVRVLERMYRQSADFLDTDLHGVKFDIESLADKIFQLKPASMAQLIAAVFELNASGEGAVRWGDKTPYYVLHMELLLKEFPGAQFIHLIRDGRDCALSMFDRKHDFRVYNTFFAAKYWEIYVARGREAGVRLGPSHYFELRYEDLLQDPEPSMSALCKFLDIPYSDTLINFKKSGEAGKTPLLQQPLQKQNQEKWRSAMSNRQISIFERAVPDTLKACGYPMNKVGRPLSLPTRALWHLHNRLLTQYREWTMPARIRPPQ